MTTYRIAPGRSISTKTGMLRHPSPCGWLSASDVDLFLENGTIEEAPATTPSPEPAASAPVSSPSAGADAVPALVLPEKFPRSALMASHLKGKSEAYILAMQAADSRTGQNVAKAYSAALKAVRS